MNKRRASRSSLTSPLVETCLRSLSHLTSDVLCAIGNALPPSGRSGHAQAVEKLAAVNTGARAFVQALQRGETCRRSATPACVLLWSWDEAARLYCPRPTVSLLSKVLQLAN